MSFSPDFFATEKGTESDLFRQKMGPPSYQWVHDSTAQFWGPLLFQWFQVYFINVRNFQVSLTLETANSISSFALERWRDFLVRKQSPLRVVCR